MVDEQVPQPPDITGYTPYTFKNGSQTVQRKGDNAVLFHAGAGWGGTPAWKIKTDQGDWQDAPFELSPTMGYAPSVQPTVMKNGKLAWKNTANGNVWFDKNMGWGAEPGWKKPDKDKGWVAAQDSVTPQATPGFVPNNPAERGTSSSGEYQGVLTQDTTPGFLHSVLRSAPVQKTIGVAKALGEGTVGIARGLENIREMDPASGMFPQAIARFQGKGLPGPLEQAQRSSWLTPSPEQESLASHVAGVAPLVATNILAGPAAPVVNAAIFGGQAISDVQDLAGQKDTNMTPWKAFPYILGNAAIGALPLPGAKDVGVLGGAAHGLGAGALYGFAPSVYRKLAFGTNENPMEVAAQSASLMGLIGAGGGVVRALAAPSGEPSGRTPGIQPNPPWEASRLLALADKGNLTPLDIAERGGISIKDARVLADQLANDPNHPLQKMGNGRYGFGLRTIPKGETNASQVESPTPVGQQPVGQESPGGSGSQGVGPGQQGPESPGTSQAQAEKGQVERRQNPNTRKEIDDIFSRFTTMTPEEQAKARARIIQLTHTDELTDLPNRRAWDESADSPHQMSTDMNDFKVINKKFGQNTGDRALRLVADAVQSARDKVNADIPEASIFVARVGGDEFRAKGNFPEHLARFGDEINNYLVQHPLVATDEAGKETSLTLEMSYGTGTDAESADWNLLEDKLRRKSSRNAAGGSAQSVPPNESGNQEPVGTGGRAAGAIVSDAARIPVGGPGAEGSPAAPTAGEQAVAPGTEAQAATPGQTPSIGPAAQTGPGEAGTVNQAPQAAETTQVAGSPGPSTETPRIGLKVGNSIIKVPVEHTDLQERLSQAESAHEQRKADIAGQFPGEENKKQRGDAYRDSGKALAQEKRAIVTEILARQSQNVPDPQPNLVARVAGETPGQEPSRAIDHQNAVAEKKDQNNLDYQDALRALRHGDTYFPDFQRTMREQLGDRYNRDLVNDLYRRAQKEMMGKPVMDVYNAHPGSKEWNDALAKAYDSVNIKYNGDGETPRMPDHSLIGNLAPTPSRDLNNTEYSDQSGIAGVRSSSVGSPSHVVQGHYGPSPVLESGNNFISDATITHGIHQSYLNALREWGADTFKGINSSRDYWKSQNGDLAKTCLRKIVEAIPLGKEADAARTAGTLDVFERSESGQRLKQLGQEIGQIKEQVRANAWAHAPDDADTRIHLYGRVVPGSPEEAKLKDMMSPSEIEVGDRQRQMYKDTGEDFAKRGGRTFGPDNPYVRNTGLSDMAPTEWAMLQKEMKKTGLSPQQLDEALPEILNFAHRDPDSPSFMPSAIESFRDYAPAISRKTAYQDLFNKWQGAIDSNFNGKAPKLAHYLQDLTQSVMFPKDLGALDQAMNGWRTATYLRQIGFSPTTAVKHAFKFGLDYTNLGLVPMLKALAQTSNVAVPDALLESPSMQKAFRAFGVDTEDISAKKAIATAFLKGKAINDAIEGTPGLEAQVDSFISKTQQHLKGITGQPTVAMEGLGTMLNALASSDLAKKAGLTPVEGARETMANILATTFRGVWDRPGYARNSLAQTLTLYSSTPFKILEQYANYALNPKAVDAFGTQNGVKLARTMMFLGTMAAVGDLTKTHLLGHAIHLPFVGEDEQTGKEGAQIPAAIQDTYDFAKMAHEGTPTAALDYASKLLPSTGSRLYRATTGNIPEKYGGSRGLYLAGIPSAEPGIESAIKGKQEKRSQQLEMQHRRSIMRNPNLPDTLKNLFVGQ